MTMLRIRNAHTRSFVGDTGFRAVARRPGQLGARGSSPLRFRHRQQRSARAVQQRCAPSSKKTRTDDAPGFLSDCGKWYIRSIRDEDVPIIADIQTEAFHEEYAFQPIDKAFKGFFRAEVLASLRGKLKGAAGTFRILVVVPADEQPDGTPVGIVEMYKNGTPDIAERLSLEQDEAGFGWLASMAVAEDRRRQGIGHVLVAASEQVVRDWGFRRTALHVFADNEAAKALYDREGFHEVAARKQHWMQWLSQRDQILMSRMIL